LKVRWYDVDSALIIMFMQACNEKDMIASFMLGGEQHYYKISVNCGERPYPYVTFQFSHQAEAKIYSLAERIGVTIG